MLEQKEQTTLERRDPIRGVDKPDTDSEETGGLVLSDLRTILIAIYEAIDWCDGCKHCETIKPSEFPCNICSVLKTNQYQKEDLF